MNRSRNVLSLHLFVSTTGVPRNGGNNLNSQSKNQEVKLTNLLYS